MMGPIEFSKDDQAVAQGKTILLVDDNSNDAFMTQRALRKGNVLNEIIWLKDGAEALDYIFGECLGKGVALPQVILLDIHMPKVDGIEVLRRIRSDERINWLPVVIFTSSKEEADLVQSYRLGVNSFICKPISLGEFVPIVTAIGCYWLLVNQGPSKNSMVPEAPH